MINFFNKLKKEGGFTLLETIIAIFVVSVGVLAAYAAVQQIFSYTFFAKSKLTAAYLAKEGIEIVRNIRDTNWVIGGGTPWNNDLAEGDWEADYLTTALTDYYDEDFLNIASGFYSYSLGTPTKYKRKITIAPGGSNDELRVLVTIEWQEMGRTQTLPVQENLWNWYGQ